VRNTLASSALVLLASVVAIDAGTPQTTATMKISGMSGQIAIQVDQTDWSRIQGLPDPTAPRTTRSTSPLSARSNSSLASRGGTLGGGGGGGGGVAEVQPLSLTKWVDAASPNPMQACATGEHISEATLTVRQAGEDVQEYLVITLENCIVESVSPQGSASDATPSEELTLSYEKVSWEYRPIEPAQRSTPPFTRSTPTWP
jgi:type VI protein secretion system component Hcp